jgi:preprotein translocase subunit SecA
MSIISKLFSAGEGKQLKKYQGKVAQINSLEDEFVALSDSELRAKTDEFRARSKDGEKLDNLLPEAFAAVREASKRTTGLRHFDVQLIGGMSLNAGEIAEMKTGEGKTLVSTLAGYLNAIPGNNVHIVTVNDYLARRDSEWMGRIYRFLGMEVGLIQNGMMPFQKGPAYKADVTYGTNSEFGFDYLRDNMVGRADMRVQRGHSFCVVDEVDSILIDEARTPLIISGPGTQAAETYKKFAAVMPKLIKDQDFDMDEAKKTITATDSGLVKIENLLGMENLYDDPSGELANHLQQALKAQFLFHRDVDYVVVDGEVKIVDEFTGRIMEGRRYSEGLHQALEAKEHVKVMDENQTLATITLQNYFRLYDKLSGMTGTAMTEDAEFRQIYKLPVFSIPPNKPVIRDDRDDLIYRTIDGKFEALADDVAARHQNGQPCLIGTVSIETSEKLSRLLDKRGIKHETLNAKNHEREANIIAQAGRVGAVTIATNMAGRGTDIILGGNADVLADDFLREDGYDPDAPEFDEDGNADESFVTPEAREEALAKAKEICTSEHEKVLSAGGLCVIGTERHESRRIDNQLRGRSGRQGDPGVTQFYLSLEDDLMRLFGGDRMEKIGNMKAKTSEDDSMPIQASMVSKAIESAQRTVEQMHFSARKNVLEYDDVMNEQRKATYGERNKILDGKDISDRIPEIISDAVEAQIDECLLAGEEGEWDSRALEIWVSDMTGKDEWRVDSVEHDDDPFVVQDNLVEYFEKLIDDKKNAIGEEAFSHLSSQIMLRMIDVRWMQHLSEMDYLKTGIGLRAVGQRDPLVEYREEAFRAFSNMTSVMYTDYLKTLLRIEIAVKIEEPEEDEMDNVSYSSPEQNLNQNVRAAGLSAEANMRRSGAGAPPKPSADKPQTYVKNKDDIFANVGRNDPCPCGSGKKFKKCHGA